MSSIDQQTGRPVYLSYSGAQTFRQCRRRWKLKYVDNIPDSRSEASLRGVFVHGVLEDLLAEAPQDRTRDRAKEIAGELWGAFRHDVADLGLDDAQERSLKWDAWCDIEGYFKLVDPRFVLVRGLEVEVDVDLSEADTTVPFKGIIDLVDETADGLRITDYKTGKVPPSRMVENRLEQVRLYAEAYRACDFAAVTVRLMYLGEIGEGRQKRRPTEIVRNVTDEHLTEARQKHCFTWNDIHRALDEDEFPPSASPLCSWCAYHDRCPEGARMVAIRNQHR